LLSAGAVVILAGGSAAAGVCFSEVRTKWEMDRALLEAEPAMTWLPRGGLLALTFVAILFALGLTGWFAAWLTGLPVIRLVRRNIVLGVRSWWRHPCGFSPGLNYLG
jgi:hypothetical protein